MWGFPENGGAQLILSQSHFRPLTVSSRPVPLSCASSNLYLPLSWVEMRPLKFKYNLHTPYILPLQNVTYSPYLLFLPVSPRNGVTKQVLTPGENATDLPFTPPPSNPNSLAGNKGVILHKFTGLLRIKKTAEEGQRRGISVFQYAKCTILGFSGTF